jgi:hypothetical protein
MNGVVIALAAMSLLYAGWMRFLGRRAAAGALARSGPGIRLPATKVCEHTWVAAQRAAAPRYTKLAVAFLVVGAVTAALGLAGVSDGPILVVWVVLAVGMQVVTLAGAGREATAAAAAVRCEHQQAPRPPRQSKSERNARSSGRATESPGTRPAGRSRPRGGRGRGGRRR